MPEVEFSDRAKEIFLNLNNQKQAIVAAAIDEAVNDPDEFLDSTFGYSEYGVQIEMNPEDFVIYFDFDKNDDVLYILTMGPSSRMNR